MRAHCARLLGLDIGKVRVTATEIGGGFGGKTVVYLEPLAIALSQKAKRPVKMVMSREEVFKASGPTSGATVRVKMGATKDGKFVAGFAELKYQAGAFQGSPVQPGVMCAYAPYDIENVQGHRLRRGVEPAEGGRLPGARRADLRVRGRERGGRDRQEARHRPDRAAACRTRRTRAPRPPTARSSAPSASRRRSTPIKKTEHWNAPLRKWQGRGVASGFWFNIGGETCASLTVNEDGTVSLMAGTPDIGGLRASLATVAADELGVPYDKVRPIIGDTGSLGFNFLTGGSRSTFSGSMAIVEAAQADQGRAVRARRKLWECHAGRRSSFETAPCRPLRRARRARSSRCRSRTSPRSPARPAAPSAASGASTPRARARASAPTWSIVEVDPETGRVTILRYTVAQDAGKALHPSYVEGQFQGGAVQGIGWALNEEYIYGNDGKLQNAGFLDYRMPVASDVPMIDAIIVEVPNPRIPYGVRGVGETPIVPPLGGHRQRHGERHRHPLHRAADVAAQGAQGAQGQGPQQPNGKPEGLQRRPQALSPPWRAWCWSATSRSSRGASPSSTSRRRP